MTGASHWPTGPAGAGAPKPSLVELQFSSGLAQLLSGQFQRAASNCSHQGRRPVRLLKPPTLVGAREKLASVSSRILGVRMAKGRWRGQVRPSFPVPESCTFSCLWSISLQPLRSRSCPHNLNTGQSLEKGRTGAAYDQTALLHQSFTLPPSKYISSFHLWIPNKWSCIRVLYICSCFDGRLSLEGVLVKREREKLGVICPNKSSL